MAAKDFFKSNWQIIAPYLVLLAGLGVAIISNIGCEELGCLVGPAIFTLFLYAAGLFSILVFVVQFFRNRLSAKYFWLIPIILFALGVFFFTILN